MPKGKKKQHDVDAVINSFVDGLKNDLRTLFGLGKAAGFNDGAVAERQRMASLIQGGGGSAVKVSPKSTPAKEAVSSKPKKLRKNPWASYTPEQKEARLANLAAARAKGRAAKTEVTGLVITVDPAVAEVTA